MANEKETETLSEIFKNYDFKNLIVRGVAAYGTSQVVKMLAKGLVQSQPSLTKKIAVAIAIFTVSQYLGEYVGKQAWEVYKMYAGIIQNVIKIFKK